MQGTLNREPHRSHTRPVLRRKSPRVLGFSLLTSRASIAVYPTNIHLDSYVCLLSPTSHTSESLVLGSLSPPFSERLSPFYHPAYRLTAIMTARFILDLHEAADPRFGSLSTDGGISALIFPDTSKHAPRVNHDVSSSSSTVGTDWIDQSSENGSVDVGECDDAEWEVSPSSKITPPCSLLTSLRSFGIKAIWRLVQTAVPPRRRNAKTSSPSSGYDDERRAGVLECHTHHVYIR